MTSVGRDHLTGETVLRTLDDESDARGLDPRIAGTSDGVGCVHALLEPKGVTQTRSAQVYFLGTVDELPRFDEKIATYSNTKSAYKKIIATSTPVTPSPDSSTVCRSPDRVAPMSFTHYGNASAAFAMTVSDSRGTLHYDYLIVRKGSVLGRLPRRAAIPRSSRVSSRAW